MHRREGKLIVSATDLVGFLACGHLTHLERAAAAGLISKPVQSEDPTVELLRWRGGKHEERYIESLVAAGRHVTDLRSHRDATYADQAAATVEAMRRGDEVIYQATVFDGRWLGYPDFLLRSDGSSSLGEWHYEVADTKLAHSAKAAALIQICSYVEQVERIQGRLPESVYVVTGGAEATPHTFRTAELMAYYRHAKQRFEAAVDDARAGPATYPIDRLTSYPDPVEHCAVCRWSHAECRRVWQEDDALPLVAGITRRQRVLLNDNAIATMSALSELEQPIALEGLKRAHSESIWNVREQARLQVLSRGRKPPLFELLEPERDTAGELVPDRGLSALPPPSDGDLFFDIEGDPFAFWEGLDYLFGVHDPGRGLGLDARWHAFWALDRRAEKAAFERVMDLFIERWQDDPTMHIYHYAAYEPTALKRLAGRHATREEELDRLLRGRVFVDLYRVVRQAVRVGTDRYSIKNLEDLYGFRREVLLRDANSSIVEFEKVLEIGDPDGALRDQIEAYNRDDCVSTHRLRDWLEARRPQLEARLGQSLPRPPTEIVPPPEDLTERERVVRDLEERVTAAIPEDEQLQGDADRATWLVAHLLDWHRREGKATWWRFFELMTLADDELLEAREPIAGLVYQGRVGETKRGNVIHRYRFPPQEHDVSERSSLHDPRMPAFQGSKLGSPKVDDANRVLDITRPPDWAGPHPTAIVPDNSVPAVAMQDALLRFGEWIADHGIDSAEPGWQAARDLLRRRPPRAGQGPNVELGGPDEPGGQTARRLAPVLDGTTLAIQGPPGSGKTYTGARMIVDLVRSRRVVGISSNSHKVIGHLLGAACRAADEVGVSLRALQKGERGEVAEHSFIESTDDNADVVRALRDGEVDVVAGTPWLWARKDMADAVDTLFVDEAGQVSLANVVAMSGAARSVVLLGDPQQLDQPTQGVHPGGAGRSALGHLLGDAEVIASTHGVFLERTYRLHPSITAFTSDLFYAGKLVSVEGLEAQQIVGNEGPTGAGLRWVEVPHEGNTNLSLQEAEVVVDIVRSLLGGEWIDQHGRASRIGPADILIVSPFNAHRLLIDRMLQQAGLSGVAVGTVDKFQGQEAPVSIYTMATSRPEDAPRGMEFLYSLNRLNVATSRARAMAIVVASPALLSAVPRTPDQLRMVNGLCAFVEHATATSVSRKQHETAGAVAIPGS